MENIAIVTVAYNRVKSLSRLLNSLLCADIDNAPLIISIDKSNTGDEKELKEVCLLSQIYVKDGDLTVEKYIENVGKAEGTAITVKKFIRFETGEGIAKKEENFAEEVAKQMGM